MADAILAAGRGDYDDAIRYLEAAQEDIDTVVSVDLQYHRASAICELI